MLHQLALPFLISALAFAICYLYWTTKPSTPLPPGPPAHPWIGHLLKLPAAYQEGIFHEWSKIYGDVTYLHILGMPVIVLNTAQAAFDLLDERGFIYSDRPKFVMYVDLLGFNPFLAVLRYGARFKRHRNMLQQALSRKGHAMFESIYTSEARILIKNLIEKPRDFDWLMRRFATAVLVRVSYGHSITSDDDKYIKLTESFTHVLRDAGNAGRTLPDLFPFLRHVPPWFPGATFARFAHKSRPIVKQLYDFPFNEVRQQMNVGTAKTSFMSLQLEALARDGMDIDDNVEDLKGAATSLYAGGSETIWSCVVTILLAMVSFPESFKRAQDEIDAVLSSNRLPELSDRSSLPFVECLHQEIYRWHPVAPLGMPHRLTEDDTYKGMYIPKGSLVLGNVRSMTLDANVYAEPHKFNPRRYLAKPFGNGEPHPPGIFGFGRRICPGRHLGDDSVWVVLATMIATLRVAREVGKDGEEVIPEIAFTSGLTSHPKPFKCMIYSRNETAYSLIQDAII